MNMEPSLSLPLIEQNVNPRVWADGKSVDFLLDTGTTYSVLTEAPSPLAHFLPDLLP